MTFIFQNLLVVHVVAGLLGVVAAYAGWLQFFKREPSLASMRRSSAAALVMFMLSWLTGGAYYLWYYGSSVRSVIKSGPYPWAHTVAMEAKEHIFLLIPFIAAAAFSAVRFAGERLAVDAELRRVVGRIFGLMTALGTVVALGGVIISGAVR